VFVAHGEARKGGFDDVAPGTIIPSSSDEGSEGGGPAETRPTPAPATNDYDRAFLLSSSSFAPPLPSDNSSSAPRHGMMPSGSTSLPKPVNIELAAGAGQATNLSPTSPLVNFTPLGARKYSNVNPAMNTESAPGHVQVMNVLDVPQASNTLAEFAMADTGFLEGIPGGMFDWGERRFFFLDLVEVDRCAGQWDAFFSRFTAAVGGNNNLGSFQ
jgi:hypothetical protein